MATKPLFEVARGVTTVNVRDVDGSVLTFNVHPVGPANYWGLREAFYGLGGMNFDQPTFGKHVPLVYASLATQDTEEARNVVSTLKDGSIIGKTVAITGKEGLLVDDNPSVVILRGDIATYERSLRDKLGKREEDGVTYSDDGTVRFVPYGFRFEEETSSDLGKNRGLIALVGNSPRAEIVAKASEFYKRNPWLSRGFDKTDKPQVRVPDVDGNLDGDRLVVGGGIPGCDFRYSFWVRAGGEAARAK